MTKPSSFSASAEGGASAGGTRPRSLQQAQIKVFLGEFFGVAEEFGILKLEGADDREDGATGAAALVLGVEAEGGEAGAEIDFGENLRGWPKCRRSASDVDSRGVGRGREAQAWDGRLGVGEGFGGGGITESFFEGRRESVRREMGPGPPRWRTTGLRMVSSAYGRRGVGDVAGLEASGKPRRRRGQTVIRARRSAAAVPPGDEGNRGRMGAPGGGGTVQGRRARQKKRTERSKGSPPCVGSPERSEENPVAWVGAARVRAWECAGSDGHGAAEQGGRRVRSARGRGAGGRRRHRGAVGVVVVIRCFAGG